MSYSPSFNLEECYKKLDGILPNAVQGKVVTRFPPEPSGYLHIGHVKAALLNYHMAKKYGGKLIFRLDDTNPSKEKGEFVDSIIEDLHRLGIIYDKLSYSSDYFDYYIQKAEELILDGYAYCDNTPHEEMKKLRTERIPSKYRETAPEENLKIFREMLKAKQNYGPGETNWSEYCLRAKINHLDDNGVMRDPVFFRCNFDHHQRTGHKYVAYPTYDFCCPLVDALEGVTHAMRSNEYADRIPLYHWVIEKCKVNKVELWQFSRLNFVNTLMSKRKLQWFVDTKRVEGWHDPRMPTVRGIFRRGLRVETLTEFMLAQGPSIVLNLMEWDKIWATNKNIVDPIAARYQVVKQEKVSKIILENVGQEFKSNLTDINPLNKAMGQRPTFFNKNVLIDFDDAEQIKGDEKITIMGIGNIQITSKTENQNGIVFTGNYLPEDKDFKKTQKITFVCQDTQNVQVNLIELDHLINVKKLEEDDTLEGVINEPSKFETLCWAEQQASELKENDVLQFLRKGYFRVDKVYEINGVKTIDCIFTPDGKQKAFSKNFKTKVDAEKFTSGKDENREVKVEKVSKKQEKKAQEAAGGKKEKKEKVEEITLPSPFVVNGDNLNLLNKKLQKQLYLSGTHKPNNQDAQVFLALKKNKFTPNDQQIYIISWFGTMNNFETQYLTNLTE